MERPENVDDRRTELVTAAGAELILIGIESGDEDLRRNLLNGRHSQDSIISAFGTAKRHGLRTHAFMMVGFPGEDRTSIMKSYEILQESQPDSLQVTIFYPLRRTKLFDKVVDERLFDPSISMPSGYYSGTALDVSNRKRKEILAFQHFLKNYRSKYMVIMAHLPGYLFTSLIHLHRRLSNLMRLAHRVHKKFRRDGFSSVASARWRTIPKRDT